ncbi:PEP-CTERM sorting domain-containing protein [Aerosakkonemataceae cyanobacterium BLCC-F154]|uniref:PEP-CTERM sorting domain-containing protein n=1 Tax=Floridaenema fluviatile BLCC-F154 TaxID=3153640 RepID=A0ABV4YG30_9CYAN
MLSKLPHTKHFLLVVTPLVASFSVASSASLAATLAFSESRFELKDFSHTPLDTATLTDTQTLAISTSGDVTAFANAEALFIPDETKAENFSLSTAQGEGVEYLGVAESLAAVIGYDFQVNPGEFSFNFRGALNLGTAIENEKSESANAYGNILFQLVNSVTGEVIDYFALYGGLNTPGEGDYLDYEYSGNITFTEEPDLTTDFNSNTEFAIASVKGTYSRTFDSLTYLTLLEVKNNEVAVKAPEPSATLALLFFSILAISYGAKNKLTNSKTKIN